MFPRIWLKFAVWDEPVGLRTNGRNCGFPCDCSQWRFEELVSFRSTYAIHFVCTHAVHHRCLRALRIAREPRPRGAFTHARGVLGGARVRRERFQSGGLDIG